MSLTIGDMVVFKTHPYNNNFHKIKIATYSDYTSPIMMVCKKSENKQYDSTTGKKVGEYIECIYYNSKFGKFEKRGLNSKDLSKLAQIKNERSHFLLGVNLVYAMEEQGKLISVKNVENFIKAEYLHKKVSLKSIDIELHKVKINKEKENGDLVETNHLEFLPPVMIVMGFRYLDEKNKFCEKTGAPLLEFKCKWYNSQSKTYSEEFFRPEFLVEIDLKLFNDDRNILNDYMDLKEGNSYSLVKLQKNIKLEDTDDVVTHSIVQIEDIIFKHYYYEACVSNIMTNKKEMNLLSHTIKLVSNNLIWGSEYPSYSKKCYKKVSDCLFQRGEFYQIGYADKLRRNTKRMVRVMETFFIITDQRELFTLLGLSDIPLSKSQEELKAFVQASNLFFFEYISDDSKNIKVYSDDSSKFKILPVEILRCTGLDLLLQTHCLLREGRIRHFRLDGIYEVKEIRNGREFFEEGKIIDVVG